MTDGASATVDLFDRANWHELSSLIRSTGCDGLLKHAAEDADPSGQQKPRSKSHDDKTVILVEK